MSELHSLQTAKALLPGQPFEGIFVLRKKVTKTARNGAPFLMIELGDKTGSCGVTVFSDSAVFPVLAEEIFEGAIVRVAATVDAYQGRFAPRIGTVEQVNAEELPSEVLGNLVETAPEDAAAMWEELQSMIAAIPHAGLRGVVESVFAEIGETFRTSSAAVAMHHAYRHGLLEHTLHMARAARALLPVYPEIDPSLALAGILLHDTGKTIEYTQGLVTKRTRSGILQGHVVLGYQMVRKHGLINKLSPDLLERLEHIVLSHQGELEWGAAAMAATPEAVFVSMVDNLDARMGMVQRVLRNAASGEEFSDYLPGLKAPVLLTPPPTAEV